MRGITKKAKLEQFDELRSHRDLLHLYLFDIQNGREPDAMEIEFNVRGQLFRSTSASGGYIVIWHIPDMGNTGDTEIRYVDDWNELLRDNHSEHTLYLRIVLERLTIARNQLSRAA